MTSTVQDRQAAQSVARAMFETRYPANPWPDTDDAWRGARELRSRWLRYADVALAAVGWDQQASELRRGRDECDKAGVPHDPEGLVRHHRGNAGLAAATQTLTRAIPTEQALDQLRADITAMAQRWGPHNPALARDLHAPCPTPGSRTGRRTPQHARTAG